MNLKHERYLEAKRAGKTAVQCTRAALPGVDEDSPRFKNWVANAEKDIPEIAKTIESENLNKPKKAAPKKKAEPEVKANDSAE